MNVATYIFGEDVSPWLQQSFYVEADGKCWVDFIGRMENLEADLSHVLDRLGLNYAIPHMNRSQHGHYRDYYDKDSREQVTKKYQRDLDLFRYTF